MTPEEKRMALKRQLLKEQLAAEQESPDTGVTFQAEKIDPDTEDKFSVPESAARGFADMGSWGTASKVEGALGAVKDYINEPSLQGFQGLKEAYKVREGLARDRYEEAAKEHPVANFVGSLPGVVMAPGSELFLPAKAAKEASLATKVGTGALNVAKAGTTGGLYGLGSSRHDLSEPGEMAKDAGAGFVGGVAGYGLGKAVPVIARGGGKIGRAIAGAAFSVPGEAAEHYLSNRAAVKSAPGLEETTRRFLDHAGQTGGDLSQASGQSFETLRNTGILSDHVGLTHPISQAATSLERGGAYGPEQKGAINFLNSLARDVEADAAANNGMLPLDRGKNLVRVLDAKIADASARPGADARVLQELRGARGAIDNFLKSSSPEYAREMEKLAADTQALTGITSSFRTPDGAQNLMKRIMRGRAPFQAEKLAEYDRNFGTNFGQDLKNSYAKDAFTKDTTNGSRKTLFGTVVGSAFGHPVLGAALGQASDKIGGRVYQGILDGSIALGKFTSPLYNAAKRGTASFAATHALLMKTSPEYRNLIQSQLQEATP